MREQLLNELSKYSREEAIELIKSGGAIDLANAILFTAVPAAAIGIPFALGALSKRIDKPYFKKKEVRKSHKAEIEEEIQKYKDYIEEKKRF